MPWLRMILAGRYDKHQDYDAQFSPKAALVFKPSEDQSIRVTYNRAFKSPTTLQTHFNITDFVPFVAVMGNKRGFTLKNAAGTVLPQGGTIDPIVPEQNTTYELGYKGVIARKLLVDATLYDAHYTNFMTPLLTIANPLAGAAATFAYPGTGANVDAKPVQNPSGTNQIVLTYRNIGNARIHGLDAGFRLLVNDRVTASATMGLMKMDEIALDTTKFRVTAGQRRELTALNAPTARWTAGMEAARIVGALDGGFTVRYSNKYFFASGINTGDIPTFTTLDVNASYPIRSTGASINLNVANLFACSKSKRDLKAGELDQQCGFDQRHAEMIRMPEVGTMVFLGVRYHRQ